MYVGFGGPTNCTGDCSSVPSTLAGSGAIRGECPVAAFTCATSAATLPAEKNACGGPPSIKEFAFDPLRRAIFKPSPEGYPSP